MPWVREHAETFQAVTLGKLRQSFTTRQDFASKIPERVMNMYEAGEFRRIIYRDEPTVIRLGDGGIVGYRVPATLVSEGLQHAKNLESWVAEFGHRLPSTKDAKRGVLCVRKYARWVKFNKGGELRMSGDFRQDKEVALEFMNRSRLLWDKAKTWFPNHHCARVFRDLTQFDLDVKQDRMCGLWPGCAVNVALEGRPVQTSPHRDLSGFMHGMSCLSTFGSFTGGDVILWELQAVLELRRGDLFFFTDHLLNHSNTAAAGSRNSVVAFMEDRTWGWIQREFGFADLRRQPMLDRRKRYKRRGKEQRNH